jgi:hypothetical protein
MNSDRENFEQLRRLLALKKYEQPPPGYFDHFSQQVIARIQGEGVAQETGFLHWFTSPIAWMQRVWDSLETRPALAGAFGFAVCGVLASGLYFSPTTPLITSIVTVDNPLGGASMSVAYQATNGISRTRSSSIFDEVRRGNIAPPARMVDWQR